MNFTLGSSWPMYQPLSLNRVALPLRTLIGSVQKAPASAATVLYLGLQPLQSSSFAAFGLTEPVAVSVFAVLVAAIEAEPAKTSWAMTEMPRAGTRKRRHDRQRCGEPGGANPDIADRVDDLGADLRIRTGNSSRSRVPAKPSRPRSPDTPSCPISSTRDSGGAEVNPGAKRQHGALSVLYGKLIFSRGLAYFIFTKAGAGQAGRKGLAAATGRTPAVPQPGRPPSPPAAALPAGATRCGSAPDARLTGPPREHGGGHHHQQRTDVEEGGDGERAGHAVHEMLMRAGQRRARGPARRIPARGAEHGHQHGQPERPADLLGDVHHAGGGARILRPDPGQRGRGQRHHRQPHPHAEQDHRPQYAGEVRRAGRDP